MGRGIQRRSGAPGRNRTLAPPGGGHADHDVDQRGHPLGGMGACRMPASSPDPEEGSGGVESNGGLVPQAGIEPARPAPEAGALSPELLGRFKRL